MVLAGMVVLVPREPPSYRLALLPPKNASPGDAAVEVAQGAVAAHEDGRLVPGVATPRVP